MVTMMVALVRASCAVVGSIGITKRLRRIPNAWHFRFALNLVFTAQWFRLGGLRCSPLNAALVCKGQKSVCGLKALFCVLAIHLLFPKDLSSK